jgi:hypothetical protein
MKAHYVRHINIKLKVLLRSQLNKLGNKLLSIVTENPPWGVYDFYWKTWDQIVYSLCVSGRGKPFSNKLASMVWWEADTQNKSLLLTQPMNT